MLEDGNLVITSSTVSTLLWISPGNPKGPDCELVMEEDGNLVIYSSTNFRPLLWSSRTNGYPGAELEMRDDGNLVITAPAERSIIWVSGSGGHSYADPHARMQSDGNLVIHHQDGTVLWSSGTGGHTGIEPHLELQTDGNVVIYFQEGAIDARWATHTYMPWMEKFGDHIANFTLRTLAIPGTHDSGTWGLDDRYWADDRNVSETIFKVDGYLPGHVEVDGHWEDCCLWNICGPCWIPEFIPHAKFMYSFAKTQPFGFTSQLNNGIRYFDMRVLYDDGNLYLIHTLKGPDVFAEINAINSYLRRNPREIVILDFNHFYTQGGSGSEIPEDMNEALAKHINHTLGDMMIPPPDDVNELTIGDIWEVGHQVVVFYKNPPDGVDTSKFWPRDKLRSKWLDQQSLRAGGDKDGLAVAIEDEARCVVNVGDDCGEDAVNQLWVLQGILTFNPETLVKYYNEEKWFNLLAWLNGNKSAAASVNDWVADWSLTGGYTRGINILLGDWALDSGLVNTALIINLLKIGRHLSDHDIVGLPLLDNPEPAPQTWLEATAQTVPDIVPPIDIRIDATGVGTQVEFGEGAAYDHIDGWLDNVYPSVDVNAFHPIGKQQVYWSSHDASGVEGVETQTVWIVAHRPLADKTELWPVNRKMVTVTIDANVVPALQGLVTLSASVDSNQPQEGMGPSDKGPDWSEPQIDQANGTIQVALRAERWDDIDRLYAITVTATDANGNKSHEVVQVKVPPTKKAKTPDCYNENAHHLVGHCAKQ